ncbi:hypothetical protein PR048_011075 [Dryococelus australis]|uniref:Uncharacterized protein n=1 Tax=Dryococelus australis TaxID=614101 RepID=A0ABQ9HKM2_9NEOP|nr:hypothetical protein PR048_011075 [Dryococelus australis]
MKAPLGLFMVSNNVSRAEHLPAALFALHMSSNLATGKTLVELLQGRQLLLPGEFAHMPRDILSDFESSTACWQQRGIMLHQACDQQKCYIMQLLPTVICLPATLP